MPKLTHFFTSGSTNYGTSFCHTILSTASMFHSQATPKLKNQSTYHFQKRTMSGTWRRTNIMTTQKTGTFQGL